MTLEREPEMHRDNISPTDLTGKCWNFSSKQFVTELHDDGYTFDAAIEAVCQVFGVTRRAARLFVSSHPAWRIGRTAAEPD